FLTDRADWIEDRAASETIALKKTLADARARLGKIPSTTVPVMAERDPKFARETRIFDRGNWLTKGELVQPGTPEIFPPLPDDGVPPRLALARWIASPENPLTARVAVNRFWLELFGTGIV